MAKKYCPHCKQHVSYRTYRRHKQFYFADNKWKEANGIQDSDSDADYTMDDSDRDEQDLLRSLSIEPDALSLAALLRTQEVWPDISAEEIQNDMIGEPEPDCADEGLQNSKGLCAWFALFITHWSFLHNVPSAAIQHLLKFISVFFKILAKIVPGVNVIKDLLPKSLHLLQKLTGHKKDRFTKYVVCTSCQTVRHYADCFRNGQPVDCGFVKYPHHRMKTKRAPCGNKLFKEVQTKTGKVFYPRSLYCYNSIINNLKLLVKRPNFIKQCNEWRTRETKPGVYRDVYDGRIWRELVQDKTFLQDPGDLAFILNLDWLQVFRNTNYGVGVLYLCLNNYPRHLRFKPENMLVVGILPGPGEPNAYQLSNYIKPLVDELLELWNPGITVPGEDGNDIKIRGLLMCCACDIPASRKIGGFLGHAAKQGCNKCKKAFRTG